MEPICLRFSEALARHWIELLRRDGFQITAEDASSGRAQLIDRGRTVALEVLSEEGGYSLNLSAIGPRALRDRIERLFLAAGAVHNIEGLSPVETVLHALPATLLAELPSIAGELGFDVELDHMLRGRIRRDSHVIIVDSGPTIDRETGSPLAFVELRPRFLLTLSPSLRSVTMQLSDALAARGSRPILVFGASPTPHSAR